MTLVTHSQVLPPIIFILVCRKQQCSKRIPHSDDFPHSKVSDSLLVYFLRGLETHSNSEQMRSVVYGFPKLDFKGRRHFVSKHTQHLGMVVAPILGLFSRL